MLWFGKDKKKRGWDKKNISVSFISRGHKLCVILLKSANIDNGNNRLLLVMQLDNMKQYPLNLYLLYDF